jgi:HEAT repeat protein
VTWKEAGVPFRPFRRHNLKPQGTFVMRRTRSLLAACCLLPLAAILCGAAPPAPPSTPAPAAGSEDEQLLKAAKVGVDAPALLDYFRQHTTPAAQQERIAALIQQLGDESFKARQKAVADLTALGAAAVPYLRHAQDDPDEEVKERAEALLKAAEGTDARAAQSAAAARLLRLRAPADAGAVLLAYLPSADNEAVEDEVLTSLAVLAVHDGKVDSPVVAALKDKQAGRRAAAGLVLGRSGTAEQRSDVQALLVDPDSRVRFRAAQGLTAGRDRAGLPILIALIKDGSKDLAFRAHELLCCIAGVRAPHAPFEDDVAARQNCHKAWVNWAQRNAKTVDLSRAEVDLPAFNASLRAREVVRQFFNALVQGDLAAFKKAADAPFHASNEPTFQTRDDLDRYFNENPMGLRNGPFRPMLLGTLPLEEYFKNSEAEEAKFVNPWKQKRADVAVFLVQQQQIGVPNPQPDPSQGMLFLVRLTGDQPHIIGVSPNRSGIKFVW